ncbi:hypothetical protein [uncultured Jatrophihabitans sp.]|uniref:hypothetical protein n=1 Tax=uncultured Jatrophihabitans sp. TaxID=1610747 RepID=UPI0035CA8AAF
MLAVLLGFVTATRGEVLYAAACHSTPWTSTNTDLDTVARRVGLGHDPLIADDVVHTGRPGRRCAVRRRTSVAAARPSVARRPDKGLVTAEQSRFVDV